VWGDNIEKTYTKNMIYIHKYISDDIRGTIEILLMIISSEYIKIKTLEVDEY